MEANNHTPADTAPSALAVGPDEAARLLGVSRDFFDEHLLEEIPHVRRGRRRIIAVAALSAWLDGQAKAAA